MEGDERSIVVSQRSVAVRGQARGQLLSVRGQVRGQLLSDKRSVSVSQRSVSVSQRSGERSVSVTQRSEVTRSVAVPVWDEGWCCVDGEKLTLL